MNIGATEVPAIPGPIVIVGGAGHMGAFFAARLNAAGAEVRVLDAGDWGRAADILAGARLVIISVPIHLTEEVIKCLPKLDKDCVLADLTSTKKGPVAAMLAAHAGPVLGLHPMFGPDVDNLKGQLVASVDARPGGAWVLDTLRALGAEVHETTAERHDRAMELVQALRHFTAFTYGAHLKDEQADVGELLAFSSPIYRLELAMVGRLFAQDADLYADIIFASKDNVAAIRAYADHFSDAVKMLEAGDKEGFKKAFSEISNYLGNFASQSLEETSDLLSHAGRTMKRKRGEDT